MAKHQFINFEKIDLGPGSQLKLGKGGLGVLASLAIWSCLALCGVAAIVALKAPTLGFWLAILAFVLPFLAMVFGIVLTLRNPEGALMPAVEYAKWRHANMGAKGLIEIPDQMPVGDPLQPIAMVDVKSLKSSKMDR